jgi:membrane protease YdiL (CAAX protease family)
MNRNLKFSKSLVVFFVISFIISWSCWIVAFSLRSEDFVLDISWLIAQIGVFAPSITAIIVTYFQNKKYHLKRLIFLLAIYFVLTILGYIITLFNATDLARIPVYIGILIIFITIFVLFYFINQNKILYTLQNTKYSIKRKLKLIIYSWLLYPVLFIILWGLLGLAFDNFQISLFERENISIVYLLIFTISFDFLYGGAVGEEIGWRGYALPLLLKRISPLWASILLGIIWSLWHLPIDMAAGFGVQGVGGVVIRMLTICPMSIITTWIYLRYNYGLVTSLMLHAGINIIPVMGFSNYELVFGVMIIIQILISFLIISADKSFRLFKKNQNTAD